MIKIETKRLQTMTSKVMKGVTFGIMPISSMIGIKVENNELFLTATDQLNYIEVKEKVVGDDMDVAVPANLLNKLVQKTTTKDVKLTLKDNYLQFKGNGNYKLELTLDDGEHLKSPVLPDIETADEKGQIEIKDFKEILKNNSVSLPKNNDENDAGFYFGGCYFGKEAITFDGKVASVTEIKLFKKPFLMCREALGLIDKMNSEVIKYKRENDCLLLESEKERVYTLELDNKELYPTETVEDFFADLKNQSSCKLVKPELLSAIDRVSIFVKEKDNRPVILKFEEGGLKITNKTGSSSEILEYKNKNNIDGDAEEIAVNYELLKSVVNVQKPEFELYFNNLDPLKFINEGTKHLLSLIDINNQIETVEVEEETSVPDENSDYISDEEIPF